MLNGMRTSEKYQVNPRAKRWHTEHPGQPISGGINQFNSPKLSDDEKTALKETHREGVLRGWKNASPSRIAFMDDPEYKKGLSEHFKGLMQREDASNPLFARGRYFRSKVSTVHPKKATEPLIARSSYEVIFLEMVDRDDSVVSVSSPKILIPYEWEGKIRNYIPDFLVTLSDGHKLLVEVKAQWETRYPKCSAKAKAGIEYCVSRGWEYVLITEPELQLLREGIISVKL
jgi:hypothetical protein